MQECRVSYGTAEEVYERGQHLPINLDYSLETLCFAMMAPFEVLAQILRTGLPGQFEAKPTEMLQPINIELEELDHDGRRSMERRKKRISLRPVAVGLFGTP